MDKKLIALMLVFFLAFILFTSIVIFNKPLSRLTRAKEEFLPSPENSLIFAWPLTAKADGKTMVLINIFVRNNNNIPLPNKKVSVISTLGNINEIQATTDKAGKASFNLTSHTVGLAEISAIINNQIKLNQTISVKFE